MEEIEIDKSLLFEKKSYSPRKPRVKSKLPNHKIVAAFQKNNFNVTNTCKSLKVPLPTWYYWMEKYPDLKYELQIVKESIKDDIEKTLIEKAKAGDTQLLLYLAKTILKDRGYGAEKSESANTNNTQVNIVLPEDTTKKYEWWGGRQPDDKPTA